MDLDQLRFFIGGGIVGAVVTTLANHASKVRLERRTALRPKDMERIDAARNYCRSLFKHEVAQVIALTYDDDPDYFLPSDFEYYDEAEQVIQDLDDRKLVARWAAYLSTVRDFSDKYPAPIGEPHRRELYGQFEASRNQVLLRLNELERGR